MASLMIQGSYRAYIEYSITSEEIRFCELNGRVVFNARTGVATPGWKQAIANLVIDTGLNVDGNEGLHAFVYKLIEEGFL